MVVVVVVVPSSLVIVVSDLCLHADFIVPDQYLDHFVDVVNVIDNVSKPSKY